MKVDYTDADFPVRNDFADSHSRYWQRLQNSGSNYTSAERIAIAEAVRQSANCPFCIERKQALSPRTLQGEHASQHTLPKLVIEAIHSISRDASRLTKQWYDGLLAQGMTEGEYIEILGIVVSIVSIDSFTDAIGVSRRVLPTPEQSNHGATVPSGYNAASACKTDQAWVPMVPEINKDTPEADLWPSGLTGNVVRAMSLVPDEVRTLKDLSAAHYLPMHLVRQSGVDAGRALNRSQMELVAGRVSALNACYY